MADGLKLLISHSPPMATNPATTTWGIVRTNTPSSAANAASTRSPASHNSLATLKRANYTAASTRTSSACFQKGQLCQGAFATWLIWPIDQVQTI